MSHHPLSMFSSRRISYAALLFWMSLSGLLLLLILFFATPASAQQPCPLSAVNRTVTICRPVAGVTYDSPIRVVAGATHTAPVSWMQLYIDGVKLFDTNTDVIDTNLILKPGTHHIGVHAVDAAGSYKQTVDVVVRTRLYPRAAYVANANDQTLSVYAVEANSGFLRQNGYVLAGAKPSGTAETWRGFVFATGGTSGKLNVYRKSVNGRLLPTNASSYECGYDCRSVAVDASGKFVYVADYAAGALRGFVLNPTTGALTPVPGGPSVTGSHPSAIAISVRGIVFVTNEGSNNVSAFAIDAVSGALTPVPGMPFATGNAPRAAAVDPFGYFLFVANYVDGTISTFRIAAGGVLTQRGAALRVNGGPSGLAIYPSGAFLYVMNTLNNTVRAFKLDLDGGMHNAGTFATGPQPAAIAMDGQGRYALVANSGAPYELWEYAVNLDTGALKFVRGTRTRGSGVSLAVAATPAPLALSPGFLYAGTMNRATLTGKIFAYSITANGALVPVPGSPYANLNGVTALAAHPMGNVLYAPAMKPTGTYTGIVDEYWVNRTTGALTPAAVYHHLEEFESYCMVLDPSGRFAYASSSDPGMEPFFTGWSVPASGGPLIDWLFYPGAEAWTYFTLDPTGKFAYRDGYNWGLGSDILQIDAITGELNYYLAEGGAFGRATIDPTGRFGYALVSGQIASYYVSGRTGVLTQVGTALPVGTDPARILVDPYARYVYVANKGSNNVSAFKANPGNGVLTPIGTFPSGTRPVGLSIDSTGNYLYVVNEASLDITAYKINQTTGALTTLAGSPYHLAASGVATSVAIIGKSN